jgi:hypothetical protein
MMITKTYTKTQSNRHRFIGYKAWANANATRAMVRYYISYIIRALFLMSIIKPCREFEGMKASDNRYVSWR